jgi:Trypsin-co-occurring domain 2
MTEPDGMDLAEALASLQVQLGRAWASGQGESGRFLISDVTLTVETVARRDKEVAGGIRWLVAAQGRTSRQNEATQTIVLHLTPGQMQATAASAVSGEADRSALPEPRTGA